jgi:hypothetical protein
MIANWSGWRSASTTSAAFSALSIVPSNAIMPACPCQTLTSSPVVLITSGSPHERMSLQRPAEIAISTLLLHAAASVAVAHSIPVRSVGNLSPKALL